MGEGMPKKRVETEAEKPGKIEMFGKGEVREKENKRFMEDRVKSWNHVRTQYYFRELLDTQGIEVDKNDLDAIDWLLSGNNSAGVGNGVVSVYENVVREKTDGTHESFNIEESSTKKLLTASEVAEFRSRYPLDKLLPLWEQAGALADKEESENPTEPGPNSPELLSHSTILSESEANSLFENPQRKYEPNNYNHYPQIGAWYLPTRYGIVNGFLKWSDGVSAVFETQDGKLRVPFRDIVAPAGRTYGEIEDEDRRRNEDVRQKEREMPY